MPEMTKEDPEPGAERKPWCNNETCGECGVHHHGTRHAAAVGSRGWFWRKRGQNLLLFFGPAIPACAGVWALWHPQVLTPLTGKQQAAINGAYEYAGAKPSTVHAVLVRIDHPGIADRLVAAGPSLAFAVLLGYLVYSLWRIEINMSAGAHPYTEKDVRVFNRATGWVWSGWWIVFGLELLGGLWYDYGPSGGWFRSGAHVPMDGLSMAVLAISGALAVVSRMYTTGARAYLELEKAV